MESQRSWNIQELREELARFETELTRAGLRPASVRTYVDRSDVFVRWLAGDYTPRGRS